MGQRRSRREIGRLLRARPDAPAEDAAFTGRLAAEAARSGGAPKRRSRVAVVLVAVPVLVLGSLGVTYATGLVHAPWRPDSPARTPDGPKPTRSPSSKPSEKPTSSPLDGLDSTATPSSPTPTTSPSGTPSTTSSASPTSTPTATTTPSKSPKPTAPSSTKGAG